MNPIRFYQDSVRLILHFKFLICHLDRLIYVKHNSEANWGVVKEKWLIVWLVLRR